MPKSFPPKLLKTLPLENAILLQQKCSNQTKDAASQHNHHHITDIEIYSLYQQIFWDWKPVTADFFVCMIVMWFLSLFSTACLEICRKRSSVMIASRKRKRNTKSIERLRWVTGLFLKKYSFNSETDDIDRQSHWKLFPKKLKQILLHKDMTALVQSSTSRTGSCGELVKK